MMTKYPKFPFCDNPWLFTLVMGSFQEAMNGIILSRHSHYWWLEVREFSPSFRTWTWHYIYLRRFLVPWLPDNLCMLSRWDQACQLCVRLFVCLFTNRAMIPSVVVSCIHLSSSTLFFLIRTKFISILTCYSGGTRLVSYVFIRTKFIRMPSLRFGQILRTFWRLNSASILKCS